MEIKRSKNKKKDARFWKQNGFLMPLRCLTNFETQKFDQNKPRFNGVSFRDNLQKIKDGEYGWVLWYWNSLDCFVHTK